MDKLLKASKKLFTKLGSIMLTLTAICFVGYFVFPRGTIKMSNVLCSFIFTLLLFAIASLDEIIGWFKSDEGKKKKEKVVKMAEEHQDFLVKVLKVAGYVLLGLAALFLLIVFVRLFVPGFAPGMGRVSWLLIAALLIFGIISLFFSKYYDTLDLDDDDEEDAEEDDDTGEGDLEYFELVSPKKPSKAPAKRSTPCDCLFEDDFDKYGFRVGHEPKGRYMTDEDLNKVMHEAYMKGLKDAKKK